MDTVVPVQNSFSSSLQSQMSLTLTIRWNWGESCEDLSWNHCTSTSHRSETNGIAERAVCRTNEGTSAVLLQSCLDEKWSADSMECYCYVRNVQDFFRWETPDGRPFGEPFNGPAIPFGLMIEHPVSAKDQSRLHQFDKKVFISNIHGMCSVYGGNLERRYLVVTDNEELEHLDASEIRALPRDSVQRKYLRQTMVNIPHSRSQLEQ